MARISLGMAMVMAFTVVVPRGVVAQDRGVGLQFGVGSAGGGVLLAGALGPRIGLRVGIHAMPRGFSTRFGSLDYDGTFPSPTWQVGLDVFPTGGGPRISGGVLLPADPLLLTSGSVEEAVPGDAVVVGENPYVPRRVGRLDVTAEGRAAVPWVALGWGGNGASGTVQFFVDAGVALWGRPTVVVEAVGAERGNPAFQADLELERERMVERLGRFRVYPLLTLGVSLPIVGGN